MKFKALIFTLLTGSLMPAGAQYIAELLEYAPAPGQLINVPPWGTPAGARSIEGSINGTVSLGSFGGYLVFRFEQAVENDPLNPYGIDFTIFGNPMPDWSEPGVVWVMKDENANGEADDTWYELAGSDYWFSSTSNAYRVKYVNPGGNTATDVPWTDLWGNTGVIRANSIYTQTYYPLFDSFPHIDPGFYELEGTLLQGQLVENGTGIASIKRAFGYADNQLRGSEPYTIPDNPYTLEIENSGGDAFDISWAVDTSGNYFDLDRVHFIKVQNGMLADGGRLGELSTELSGAVDVPPDASISGETDMVVIRDLPPLLKVNEYQLEVKVFKHGRLDPEHLVQWSTSHPGASIDENHFLRITEEGPLSITAVLWDRPEIKATVSTTVSLTETGTDIGPAEGLVLYPNPTRGTFRVLDATGASICLYESSGKLIFRVEEYQEGTVLDIGSLATGIYAVQIMQGENLKCFKLLKQ